MDNHIIVIPEGELGTRPSWDEYMMHLAIGVASRSSCKHVHSGTVITSASHEILATGYNGAGSLIKKNCLETGCRKELKGLVYETSLGSGECIGVHSEINAGNHLSKRDESDLFIYNTIFPCHTCTKNFFSRNLKRVIFKRPYHENEMISTLEHLSEAGIEVCQLDLSPERDMDIRYNHSYAFFGVWSDKEKERIKRIIEGY
jgi:dCMP deaminase